ncbi:hypothetical protein B0H17DRAFT_502059 [Mycena rosella]|uniref:Helicase C-terminal domain-containing protein n=1 Tax=Mycena rosella TaxID=1033263 RepID=A0AAD7GG85_MYCRO|nr:hypothetical protein B0H17DRAFT_502059 [Mycena rosella]
MLARCCQRRLPVGRRSLWGESPKTANLTLKDWQEDAIQTCTSAIQGGRTRIGMHICGPDRATTVAVLMDRIPPPNPDATRLMIVAVSEQRTVKISGHLSRQREDAVAEQLGVKVKRKSQKGTQPTAPDPDVSLLTYNAILKRARCLTKTNFVSNYDEFKAIVLFDAPRGSGEFYDFLASRLGTKTSYFPPVVGTCSAEDFNALQHTGFFPEVTYRHTLLDHLQETGECPARFLAVPAPLTLNAMRVVKEKSRFIKAELSKKMSHPDILQLTIQAWLDNAAARKSTVVYCVDDRHGGKLVEAFQKVDIDVERVSPFTVDMLGQLDPAIAKFKSGASRVLVISEMDAEFDLPQTDCVLMACPVLDKQTLTARILSGMKASPDTLKEDTLVIDIVDSVKKRPDYNICDLIQLKAADIDGQHFDVLKHRAEEQARLDLEATPSPTPRTPSSKPVPVKQRPVSVALASQGRLEAEDRTLKVMSGFFSSMRWSGSPGKTWLRCGPGIYVHDCFDHGHAILQESEPQVYEAYWTPRRLDSEPDADEGSAAKLSVPGTLLEVLPRIIEFLGKEKKVTRRYLESKATPTQLEALRGFCTDEMPHVLYHGKPMPTDDFFKWLTVEDVSRALARLRYSPELNVEPFIFSEQTVIVGRIQAQSTASTPFALVLRQF